MGDDRRADWSFGLGLVAAASLLGIAVSGSASSIQVVLAVLFLGSGVVAMVLGLVVMGRRHAMSIGTVKTAFIGVALGGLVAAAAVFWVLLVIFAIQEARADLPFLSQQSRSTLSCISAEQRAGVPIGQAFEDCSGCPPSGISSTTTGNGSSGSGHFCVVRSTSFSVWPIAVIPFGAWLLLVAAGWRVMFQRPFRPPPARWPG